MLHQIIESGNRLFTSALVILTLLFFLSVMRVGHRKEIKSLVFLNGLGVIVQAVIGGISVWVDLKWYVVALYPLPSTILVWPADMPFVKISKPNDGTATCVYPCYLRYLAITSGLALTVMLITGTTVAGVRPHVEDALVLPENRPQLPTVDLVHTHAGFMYLYLGLVIDLILGLLVLEAFAPVRKIVFVLVMLASAQGVVGMIQYWSGVPGILMPVYVAGSGTCTTLTAVLFQHGYRTVRGSTVITSPLEDNTAAATAVSEKNVEVSVQLAAGQWL